MTGVAWSAAPHRALAAGVVGSGTAASCTEAALNTALGGGGAVTFNCGSSPVTINATTTKNIFTATTVDGGGLITLDGGGITNIFAVTHTALTLANLTLNAGAPALFGISSADLTVTNCTVSNSPSFNPILDISGCSGAVVLIPNFLLSGASKGSLAVTGSTFTNNMGDILSVKPREMTINDSTFSVPSSFRCTGIGVDGGRLVAVAGSTFDGTSVSAGGVLRMVVRNSSFVAGGVSNSGHAFTTIENSTFSPGSVFNNARMDVNESTFSNGTAAAIDNAGGRLTVRNSTFANNTGGTIGNGPGFGVVRPPIGRMVVINDTFVGNTGGAIANGGRGSTVTVNHSTFFNDSAAGTAAISNTSGGSVSVRNSIVANDSATPNCAGPIFNAGNNLDSGTSCVLSIENANPMLDPAGLSNNGGPTQTIAVCGGVGMPAAGCTGISPAVNAAGCNPTDQRGYVRPGTGSGRCTIGAYEFNSSGCPSRQTQCGAMNVCATLASDPENCGTCGTVCAAGQKCQSGTCQ